MLFHKAGAAGSHCMPGLITRLALALLAELSARVDHPYFEHVMVMDGDSGGWRDPPLAQFGAQGPVRPGADFAWRIES